MQKGPLRAGMGTAYGARGSRGLCRLARARALLRWMLYLATELYPLVEWDDCPERFTDSPDAGSKLRERAQASPLGGEVVHATAERLRHGGHVVVQR